MDVLALIICGLLIFLLMQGSLPLMPRRSSPPRTYTGPYLRSIFISWLLLGIVGIIMLHDDIPLASIGLRLPTLWWPTLLALIGVSLLFVLFMIMYLRIIKKEPYTAEEIRRLALPRTPSERLLWVGISITAGIWEEIVFRGFLPWYFQHHLFPPEFPISFVWASLCSLILFSLGHLYQGWRAALIVGVGGIFLTLLYVVTGNLLASILWHFLWDVRFLYGVAPGESPAPTEDEVKATSIASLQPSSPILSPERTLLTDQLWSPDQSTCTTRTTNTTRKRRRRNKRGGKSHPKIYPPQRVPYYSRRLPPYPDIHAARHQLPIGWKKYRYHR